MCRPFSIFLQGGNPGDDSPQDGSRSDTATTQCEQSETPSQMTLTPFQESKPTASDD